MDPSRPVPFKLGSVQGFVPVPEHVASSAASVARDYYAHAVQAEFCENPVDMVWASDALPPLDSWFPDRHLQALGLRSALDKARRTPQVDVLATYGVDCHTDNIHGLTLIWVLYNDGLVFRQGKVAHATRAGEWFVFDDRKLHAVLDGPSTTTYLCVSVPLERLPPGSAMA